MSNFKNGFPGMLLALFSVTFFSAATVGFVHNFTKYKIKDTREKMKLKAVEKVLPEYASLSEEKFFESNGKKNGYYIAYKKNGKLSGVAVKASSMEGYSGLIEVMAGIDAEGMISGYRVLSHKETPGLGSKMQKWFSDKKKTRRYVIGRDVKEKKLSVSKDGGEVDAITSATISSRAFLKCLNSAGGIFMKIGEAQK